MFQQLWGLGEEEEEEEEEEVEVTGAPSNQAGDPHLAGRDRAWQSVGAGCRTLGHPSLQLLYSALCTPLHPPPEGPAWEAGPLPFLDRSSFFYTDPTQPPGYRIYNWLSCCSLQVLHQLHLDTPAPIMAPRETPPTPGLRPRRRWVSSEELQAVSALLELPAAAAQGGAPAEGGAERGDP